MARLANKTAVITGGTTGIGSAAAELFIKEGAKVIITGRNQERLDEAVAKLGDQAIAVKADVQSVAEIENLAAQVKQHFGEFDILFANAGVAKRSGFRDVTEAQFDQEIAFRVECCFENKYF